MPAVGFSLGFERIVDLVELEPEAAGDNVALVYDDDVDTSTLIQLKQQLIAQGKRVRVERQIRNQKVLLVQLAASGFTSRAMVTNTTRTLDDLEFVPLSGA